MKNLLSNLSITKWFVSMFVDFERSRNGLNEFVKWCKNDVKRLNFWIQNNIEWSEDKREGDEWMHPLTLFIKRKGDCEDVASLMHYVVSLWGWKDKWILCAYPVNGSGHAVFVYLENNKYYYSDLSGIHRVKQIEDIPFKLYSDCSHWSLTDREGIILFKKEVA